MDGSVKNLSFLGIPHGVVRIDEGSKSRHRAVTCSSVASDHPCDWTAAALPSRMRASRSSSEQAMRWRGHPEGQSGPARLVGANTCLLSAPPIERRYNPIPRPARGAPTTGPVAIAAKSRARAARRISA